MSHITPKIYVACLAAYNNATLHGTWIDADQSVEDLQTEIDDKLKTSRLSINTYGLSDLSRPGNGPDWFTLHPGKI
jgi:hypothetical protein